MWLPDTVAPAVEPDTVAPAVETELTEIRESWLPH